MDKKQQRAQQWREKQNDFTPQQPQMQDPATLSRHEVHNFLEWEAPGRPFKERSREFFINSFLIMMVVEIILFLFSQYLLMAVIFSLVFLSFALSSVPPRTFHYRISSEGILIDRSFFLWKELYDFYFFKHHGQETLHITTETFFPGELTLTLGDVPVDDVKRVMLPFLPYREHVEPTWLEKAGNWLESNFPLERVAR